MEVNPDEVAQAMSEECLRYFDAVEFYVMLSFNAGDLYIKEKAGELMKAAFEFALSARKNAASAEPDEFKKKILEMTLEMLRVEVFRDYENKSKEIWEEMFEGSG